MSVLTYFKNERYLKAYENGTYSWNWIALLVGLSLSVGTWLAYRKMYKEVSIYLLIIAGAYTLIALVNAPMVIAQILEILLAIGLGYYADRLVVDKAKEIENTLGKEALSKIEGTDMLFAIAITVAAFAIRIAPEGFMLMLRIGV